jgi:hypothetical protein
MIQQFFFALTIMISRQGWKFASVRNPHASLESDEATDAFITTQVTQATAGMSKYLLASDRS